MSLYPLACKNVITSKLHVKLSEVFSGIFEGPGDGAQIVRFFLGFSGSRGWDPDCDVFSRIFGGPGDGAQIVRFFPGFSGVPGMEPRL